MKQYPSITRSTGQSFQEIPHAMVWDKLDGSSMRAEWRRNRGWFKFGSRTQLISTDDRTFAPVIPCFKETLADPLARLAHDQRWTKLLVFMEYWGPQSFAGHHVPGDPMTLTPFDIDFDNRGIVSSDMFLKLLRNIVPLPNYLGCYHWTRGFVEQVRLGEIPGITFEGVVGKAGSGHNLIFAKAKTQAWIDKVHARYAPEEARRIVES